MRVGTIWLGRESKPWFHQYFFIQRMVPFSGSSLLNMFFGDKSHPGNVSSFFEGTRQKPNFNQLFSMDWWMFADFQPFSNLNNLVHQHPNWYGTGIFLPTNSPLKSSDSHVSKLIPTWFFPEKSVPNGFQEMNRRAGHHTLRVPAGCQTHSGRGLFPFRIYPSVHNGPKNHTYFNGVKWDPCKWPYK